MTKPLPRPEPSANPISGSRNVPWATIWTTAGWTSPYEEMAPEGASVAVVGTVVAAAAAVVGGAGGALAAVAAAVVSADSSARVATAGGCGHDERQGEQRERALAGSGHWFLHTGSAAVTDLTGRYVRGWPL